MIDLATLGPVPTEASVSYSTNLSSESGCEEGFAGGYSPQEKPVRSHSLQWVNLNKASVAGFLNALETTADGNVRVMFTPPPPSMRTIVGRLVGPFPVQFSSRNRATISGTLEEDF